LYALEAELERRYPREGGAAAPAKAGIKYERLIEKIVALGLRRGAV